jgi:hypothetical protein
VANRRWLRAGVVEESFARRFLRDFEIGALIDAVEHYADSADRF